MKQTRTRTRVVVLALALAVAGVVLSAALAGAVDRGDPDVDVFLEDPEVEPGSEEVIELQVGNDGSLITGSGEQVLTVRSGTLEVSDSGPFEVTSGSSALGTIPDGEVIPTTQRLEVPDDIEPGEHDITVEVSYTYVNPVRSDGSVDRHRATERETVTLVVREEPRFAVTDVATDVEPGGTGDAVVEIENTGPIASNQTRTSIVGGSGISVDGATPEAPAEEIIGDLEPNESTKMTVDVAVDDGISAGDRPLEIDFFYEDENGIERQANGVTTTLLPAPEQTFAIDDLESTLAVGYDGRVTGTITNEGPRAVDDAVLDVTPQSESLFIEDTRYALPELEPGESTEFRYPTDVSGQADAGPRQLQFTVEYGSGDRTTATDGPISERVVVDEKRDEFTVETLEADIRQGETSEVVLEITNERPETLSNIDANLYTDSPLSSPNDDAFVGELAPGESAQLRFEIGATPDAALETHPVELDFEYDTERGDTVISDVYQHPVDVGAAEDDDGDGNVGTIVTAMVMLTAAGLGVGMWWRRS
ncbi:COG1361 S-layer family protein [Halobiforma nitratireducens]|uniref:Uncharacterized protein n=1 Tax=Halobiforma nitratireducens JCM 10879 TaxID=1227454 RepID=M0MML1_9EURY|nr:hypothetical protein [Halobiforma nitratireducens]EMA45974.1 hypothetical protein C446_01808 [Halobiforma nitratireducens JCM 10879]